MDVYQRYLSNDLLTHTNLNRAGFTRKAVATIRTAFSSTACGVDQASLRKLLVLGYRQDEAERVWKEIKDLLFNYHCEVLIGNCSTAPCSAWRAERLLLGDEAVSRFAKCVHLFEKKPSGMPGRYLGYVMLRPRAMETNERHGFAYTTVANLLPPRYLLRPRYHVIAAVLGGADGLLPFRGVPFCSPGERDDKDGIRASCLHGAMQAALLLTMNRFGCVPISSVDMITCLWEQKHRKPGNGRPSLASIARTSITLDDGLSFLNDAATKAGGNLQTFTIDAAETTSQEDQIAAAKMEAKSVIMDYLANGIPLIMAVKARGILSGGPTDHAIVVFGMHVMHDPQPEDSNVSTQASDGVTFNRDSIYYRELPDKFVVHDTTFGPYIERTADNLLTEAWVDNNLSFLAVMPVGANVGIKEVRWSAVLQVDQRLLAKPDFWSNYVTETCLPGVTTPPEDPSKLRLIVRLLSLYQMKTRYLTSSEEPVNSCELREDDLVIRDISNFWCVEVKLPNEHSTLKYAGGEMPPAFVLIWNIADPPGNPRVLLQFEKCMVNRPDLKTEMYRFILGDGRNYAQEILRQSA